MACVPDYARMDLNFEDFITSDRIYDVYILSIRKLLNSL